MRISGSARRVETRLLPFTMPTIRQYSSQHNACKRIKSKRYVCIIKSSRSNISVWHLLALCVFNLVVHLVRLLTYNPAEPFRARARE